MTGKAFAAKGKIKATGLVRDKHGRPRVERHLVGKFMPHLTDEDKVYLRGIYPDLEI